MSASAQNPRLAHVITAALTSLTDVVEVTVMLISISADKALSLSDQFKMIHAPLSTNLIEHVFKFHCSHLLPVLGKNRLVDKGIFSSLPDMDFLI